MSTPAESRFREATRPRHRIIRYCYCARGGAMGLHPGECHRWAPGRHCCPRPRLAWTVTKEDRPWIDGAHVPMPAVWVVRKPDGEAAFVTDSARLARRIAGARAHGRPDPVDEEEDYR